MRELLLCLVFFLSAFIYGQFEMVEGGTAKNIDSEIPKNRSGRNLWPNDPSFFMALHSSDRSFVLSYYKDESHFTHYTDKTQEIFVRGALMGKLTYDAAFLSDAATSEYLLQEIFDRNLPCQSCIVRIVQALEDRGNILETQIPQLLRNQTEKLLALNNKLISVREADCECPEELSR